MIRVPGSECNLKSGYHLSLGPTSVETGIAGSLLSIYEPGKTANYLLDPAVPVFAQDKYAHKSPAVIL